MIGSDTSRMEETIARQSTRVYRLCLSYVKNRQDAEDLMQEVFERYLRKPPVFHSEEHEKAWFLRVGANAAKSYLRSARLRHHSDSELPEIAVPEEDHALKLTVLDAVNSLSTEKRACVYLFYYEERSIEQIAKTLGMQSSTVKSHLHRARLALAQKLEGIER